MRACHESRVGRFSTVLVLGRIRNGDCARGDRSDGLNVCPPAARGWSPQVTELGKALTSADLKDRTFILAGFTDAKGSQTYNQGLSERRADAVRQLLSKEYGIEAGNLVTVGYGLSHLKDPANPFAAENRRVQVINAAEK